MDTQARRVAIGMVTPALVLMILVAVVPIGYAIWLSLNQYSLIHPGLSRFVGLGNYIAQLTSSSWWQAFGFSFVIGLVSVPLELIAGTGLAMLLNLAFKGRAVLRSVLLMPYAIMTVVSAIVWSSMFDPHLGLLTTVLKALHLPGGDVVWLANPGLVTVIIILAEVWKTAPFVGLLVLAGLQVIPQDVFEAAAIDGATRWQTFWRVTLPLLAPAIAVAGVLRLLDALRMFDLPYVFTRGANGTSTMSVLVYNTLYQNQQTGEGSALGILTFTVVMVVALVYIRFAGGNLRQIAKESR
ncbi:carbohydrate ABC transporter permease [Microbacterium sp. B2969]|uniref:Carbohydrate ABC transporter permease n=2 Tax=Microbacterium alkaliflavum TaxID=3248839 RepID=A0ABW7Q478_9MICO